MAISTTSLFFTSPNFTFKSNSSISASVKNKRPTISSAYVTAERNASPSTSLYEVLGVRIGADMREVKSAYRKLARVLHPDVGSRDSSADEFMKVNSAYITLADPKKRADYDRMLMYRRTGDLSTAKSAGGYKCRRWETDQCW